WPAIAMALHRLAEQIGAALAPGQDRAMCQAVGTRALATALLFVLAGRGDEVHQVLRDCGFAADAEFESTVLEFLALCMAVEGVRLPFAHLDLILHLAAI